MKFGLKAEGRKCVLNTPYSKKVLEDICKWINRCYPKYSFPRNTVARDLVQLFSSSLLASVSPVKGVVSALETVLQLEVSSL